MKSIKHQIINYYNGRRGYGIVSFGTKDLQWVIDYVLNQKEHHKKTVLLGI